MDNSEILSSVCRAVSSSSEFHQLCEKLQQGFSQSFGEDFHSCIALLDAKTSLIVSFYPGQSQTSLPNPCDFPGNTLASRVLLERKPILVANIGQTEVECGIQCIPEESASWFGFPISFGEMSQGLIVFQSKGVLPIEIRDFDLFANLGQLIGASFYSKRSYDNNNTFTNQLAIVAEIARETTGPLEINHIIEKSTELLKERFGFFHVAIYLVDPLGQYALLREPGKPPSERKKIAINSPSLIARAIANIETIILDDNTRFSPEAITHIRPEAKSSLVVPLKTSNWVLGAIDIQSTTTGQFSPEYTLIFEILCDQIALALEKARLFEQTIHRIEREQKVIEIASKFRSANDITNVLQIAVKELKIALNTKQVQIILQRSEDNKKLEEFIK